MLVFAAAFSIDARALARNLLPILVLALPVMLVSTLVTAALVRWVPPLSERLPGPRWLSGIVAVPQRL